jgi:hypothetical protein
MPATSEKCAHGPCTCKPAQGDAYCSDYCRHEATSGPPREEKVCECGHKGCAGHPAH